MSHFLSRTVSYSTIAVLSLLLLIGPLHAFAVKGFAPALALIGIFGLITVLSSRKIFGAHIIGQRMKSISYVLPFIVYVFLAVFWSSYEGALSSFLTTISIIIFTIAAVQTINQYDSDKRRVWERLLIISMIFGSVAVMLIGPYNVYWPNIEADLNYPFELIRQVNRSLVILPIILMLIGAALPPKYRTLAIVSLACAFGVTYYSNSQSGLLAVGIGSAGLILGYAFRQYSKFVIWVCITISLIGSPFVHVKSFENKWVDNYLPKVFLQKGSALEREWLYYVYAKEILKEPIIGHGLRSSRSFEPANMSDYITEGETRGEKLNNFVSNSKDRKNINLHPHNIFLQIIFEFGYLGAILFLIAMWQILKHIDEAVDQQFKPWIWGAFGAGLGGIMFSHSIWQTWSLSIWGICIILACTLCRTNRA